MMKLFLSELSKIVTEKFKNDLYIGECDRGTLQSYRDDCYFFLLN